MSLPRQRGVALITVLLIMALALLLTGSLLRSHRLTLQGSTQHIHQVQLRQWALAAEGWAGQLLQGPLPTLMRNVNLVQDWAQRPLPLTLPGVEVRLDIEDLAGRFNLTPLLAPGKADEIVQARWARLLERLDIAAIDLAPLRGTEVVDPSQLRLLPGMDEPSLRRLEPWVALLPGEARLNVNTTHALLLSTLEGMTDSDAQMLIQQRPAEGYPDAATFALASGLKGRGVAVHGLGVGSRWFRASVEVAAGRSRLRLVSDLELDPKTGRVRVVQRRFLAPTQGEPSL
ncbi:type II secretory pathway, component PulK [Pseudomonas asplenii]|uniref:Type II secretion system protein K n=1 Tax=Pseudomonas asplenii TaxID=53407 RepID=A0A0N0E5G5_9PSED|nr:type II secretion system protein GspK [Pseudomonas fuscovaginae]KPA92442.1 type II secretory pathway, component PulK [Pseudomonas fuscovaginae]